MHDEFHEYVEEEKKKAYGNHCGGFPRFMENDCKFQACCKKNLKAVFHRDKLQQPTTNEHTALEEVNQSQSMIACGHGTTETPTWGVL